MTQMTGAGAGVGTSLLRAVIAKSFLELIFVCVVASAAAFSHFSPLLRGAVDAADATRVAGWVYDPRAPGETVEVQLFIDGRFALAGRADLPRPDLVAAGAALGADHGFEFALSGLGLAPGAHTARVYAVRRAAGRSKMLVPLAEAPLGFEVGR